ncbi:MAG: hypothetical protein J6E32_06610 [Lachnospiraceae bacterium]|nr:hypothetical protein [Lachnospiraceae bacterium]
MGIGRKKKKQQEEERVKKQARRRGRFITLMTMIVKGSSETKSVYKKRSRQLRRARQILQAAVRIINALDQKTVYRR